MSGENVLLAEDTDIQYVIEHLCKQRSVLKESFTIKNKYSVTKLLNELPIELKSPELQRLAIVLDMDADVNARWQSLKDRLIKSGYQAIPNSPHPTGTIVLHADLPIVGIWLMPNNSLPGMVEDFASFLVPENDLLWKRAEECISQIPQNERLFSHFIKAHIHTWLAWQEEPGRPLGQAITRRYLDPNASAPQADQLIQWLKQVFDL